MSEFSDVSTVLHLLLLEDAEKHKLNITAVRCFKSGSYADLSLSFDNGHTTRVGMRMAEKGDKDLLSLFLDLARSKRGQFQLWASQKRSVEYHEGLAAMAERLGNSDGVNKISSLAKDFDPADCVTRKVGRTPGGRTYEVVDGPWGRRVVVIDEAMETACQRGPFVKSATRIYKLADPGGMNGNTSKAKGWVRRARLYSEPRNKCRFLQAFVERANRTSPYHTNDGPTCPWAFNMSDAGRSLIQAGKFQDKRLSYITDEMKQAIQRDPEKYHEYFERRDTMIAMVPIDFDLAGTHDPALVPVRARKLALLAAEIATHGEVLPELTDWKKKHKLAFPLEHVLFKRAWSLSYYEDAMTKADAMYASITQMFQNDEVKWQQLADRFKEVV